MNILVDIGHPGQVHLFKNFIKIMKNNNHKVLVTTKKVPSITNLLKENNIEFISIGSKSDRLLSKFVKQIEYNFRIYYLIKKYKINIGIGSSVTVAQISRITKMKSIIFDDDDDDVEPLFVKYCHPFSDTILSPLALSGFRKSPQTIFYPGYHELAYLHPKRFEPDERVLKQIGLNRGETFFILRFNAFKAHHDVGINGLNDNQKKHLVHVLESFGKVLITTERGIDPIFKKYQILISPDKIHSLIYYSSMFLGDSQTMTSEAAVLGVPAIRCNDFVGRISYLEEEEHEYGLTYGYKPCDYAKMISKIKELVLMPDLKKEFQSRRKVMLDEKIDVTAFMVWFIENYPSSISIRNDYSSIQERFK